MKTIIFDLDYDSIFYIWVYKLQLLVMWNSTLILYFKNIVNETFPHIIQLIPNSPCKLRVNLKFETNFENIIISAICFSWINKGAPLYNLPSIYNGFFNIVITHMKAHFYTIYIL